MKPRTAAPLAIAIGLAGGAAVTVPLAVALGPVFEARCRREGRNWCGFEGALSAGFVGLLVGLAAYLLIGFGFVHRVVPAGERAKPALLVMMLPVVAFLGVVVLSWFTGWY